MATVEPISGHRKRRTRSEVVREQVVPSSRPQRELILEGLLAPGLRVRIWSAGHSLTPSQV